MGFFDRFTDKREKYDYMRGSDFLYNLVLMQKDQYTESFNDIEYADYRSELIGIAAAYLDKEPSNKTFKSYRSFGECILYYGTVHADRVIKDIVLPKSQAAHKHYNKFFSDKKGMPVRESTARVLAQDIMQRYNVAADPARTNAMIVDITKMVEIVDAVLSTYRFVD